VSDLRVVYEIQSRLREGQNDLQAAPDESLPKSNPEKEPGQTDDQKPAQPRQQNRANELARRVELLAAECPVLLGEELSMKCAVHPEVDASGYCRNCGKPMCAACVRPVRDVLYCEECLAQVMGLPAPHPAEPVLAQGAPEAQGAAPPAPVAEKPGSVSPVLAFILGFIRVSAQSTTASTTRR